MGEPAGASPAEPKLRNWRRNTGSVKNFHELDKEAIRKGLEEEKAKLGVNGESHEEKLPTLPPSFPKYCESLNLDPNEIAKDDMGRHNIVYEMITTELGYVSDLMFIVEMFVVPLRTRYQEACSAQDCQVMFQNVEEFVPLHKELLQGLLERLKSKSPLPQNVADIYLPIFPKMKIYSSYLCRFNDAQACVVRLMQDNPKFGEYMAYCNAHPACKNLDMCSWLIKPVQRVMKYPLLLRDLMKKTEPEHADYGNIQNASQLINDVLDAMNEDKRVYESDLRTEALSGGLLDGISDYSIGPPARRLVREGDLYVWEHGKMKERYAFLFQDILMVCKIKDHKKGTYSLTDPIKLEEVIVIEGLADTEDFTDAFRLMHIAEPWTFVCADTAEREGWLKALTTTYEAVQAGVRENHARQLKAVNVLESSGSLTEAELQELQLKGGFGSGTGTIGRDKSKRLTISGPVLISSTRASEAVKSAADTPSTPPGERRTSMPPLPVPKPAAKALPATPPAKSGATATPPSTPPAPADAPASKATPAAAPAPGPEKPEKKGGFFGRRSTIALGEKNPTKDPNSKYAPTATPPAPGKTPPATPTASSPTAKTPAGKTPAAATPTTPTPTPTTPTTGRALPTPPPATGRALPPPPPGAKAAPSPTATTPTAAPTVTIDSVSARRATFSPGSKPAPATPGKTAPATPTGKASPTAATTPPATTPRSTTPTGTAASGNRTSLPPTPTAAPATPAKKAPGTAPPTVTTTTSTAVTPPTTSPRPVSTAPPATAPRPGSAAVPKTGSRLEIPGAFTVGKSATSEANHKRHSSVSLQDRMASFGIKEQPLPKLPGAGAAASSGAPAATTTTTTAAAASSPSAGSSGASADPATGTPPPASLDGSIKYYDLAYLRRKPLTVDTSQLEMYLSDPDFVSVFGVDKATFKNFPAWKRDMQRKKHQLF